MGTHDYRDANNKKIPSVTTITGMAFDNSNLIAWANRMGLEGRDSGEVRDEAARIGTITHAMIETNLSIRLGKDPGLTWDDADPDELLAAKRAFQGFVSWSNTIEFDVVKLEHKMESDRFKLGGCPDMIARVGADLCVFDWKTSGGLYPAVVAQLAAYRFLWNCDNEEQIHRGFAVRFDRDDAGLFECEEFDETALDEGIDTFHDARRLYDSRKLVVNRMARVKRAKKKAAEEAAKQMLAEAI